MKKERCPICGEGSLSKRVTEEEFEYKGKYQRVPNYVVYECNVCGESIVDKTTLKKSAKILKDFRRTVDGLLLGDEIKMIRRKLQLTQVQTAEILGGGLKSFAKYESGQTCQSRAMDNLLRILDKYPFVIGVIPEANFDQHTKIVSIDDYKKYKQRYVSKKEFFGKQGEDIAYGI